MVPLLFPGIPGGIELLVILLMMGLFFLVPLALVVVAYLYGKRQGQAESAGDDAGEGIE